MKEHIRIDASVASHKGNVHSKNEEKFYLNGQYMDLNQQKDSTVKASHHSYKQSVYGIASGTVRGALGEQAAFIAVEALSRYHLYLEETTPSSFLEKKQKLMEYLKSAEEKIRELAEDEDLKGLGATMMGLIIDGSQAFGFSLGEEGFYMVEKDIVRKVSIEHVKEDHFIGSMEPVEKILRITDEFELEQGDRLLLTSKDTYTPDMEGQFIKLISSLSTKESIKAYVKEMLNRKKQKNLTALLVYVEALEGFAPRKNLQPLRVDNEEKTDDNLVNREEERVEDIKEAKEMNNFGVVEEDDKTQGENEVFQSTSEKDQIDSEEESERNKIFEQRYRESQMLFNKKVQRRDLGLNQEDEEYPKDASKDSYEKVSFSSETTEKDLEEEYGEEDIEKESPWRTRSKFLLVALLAVGVILMAFAFGTIRNLEQRRLSPSAENEREEEVGDDTDEGMEEEVAGDPSDEEIEDEELEESEEETSSEDGDTASEEEESLGESEATENDQDEEQGTGETETTEGSEVQTTYEVQSGDTLFSISRSIYGDGSKVEEIINLNNIEDINNIQVGDVLQLPPKDE